MKFHRTNKTYVLFVDTERKKDISAKCFHGFLEALADPLGFFSSATALLKVYFSDFHRFLAFSGLRAPNTLRHTCTILNTINAYILDL